MVDGGGLIKPESVGASDGDGVPGVGSGAKVWITGTVGDGVGVIWTKIGCDSCGDGVGEPVATPPPGRAKATSMAPITSPTSARARAARMGSRLPPDATARRLGYVTPAANPATGKRW
jgi:hypothetical protein